MKRVGIFGGTFNPIHVGHVRAALAFLQAAELDELLVIPAKTPPHKTIEGEDDPQKRLDMTRLAFSDVEGREKITISDLELSREGKSYSFDTVTALHDENTELFLYCGTDMLLSFDRWYRFQDILSMVTIAYAGREEETEERAREIEAKMAFLRDTHGARILTIPLSPMVLSSTEVRARLQNGEDMEALLPPPVYQYIKEMRLYGYDSRT